MEAKGKQFPGLVDLDRLPHVQEFYDFDTHYTAKLHGFKDAADFYEQASPHTRIQDIRIPTLILNAKNDPLLGEECYSFKLFNDLKTNPQLKLDMRNDAEKYIFEYMDSMSKGCK